MKKILILVTLFCISVNYAQEPAPKEAGKPLAFRQITPEQKFESDIKKDSFTIYTLGGLKPYNYEVALAFQKKFHVKYHDFGCLAPTTFDFYEKYNILVFNHLKEKWGREWEKDIKDNAIGFSKWKETQ